MTDRRGKVNAEPCTPLKILLQPAARTFVIYKRHAV